ncbi:hypothetical protein KI387_000423, partial [Taxus chinensis]
MVAEPPLWHGWVTLSLLVLMMIASMLDVAPHLVMMLTVTIFIPLKIIDLKQAMRGFSDDAVLSNAVLFVVARGKSSFQTRSYLAPESRVEQSGVLEHIAKLLFKTTGYEEQNGGDKKKNMLWVLLQFLVPLAIVSAFVVNTPLVALMIPFILKFHKKGKKTKYLNKLSVKERLFEAVIPSRSPMVGKKISYIRLNTRNDRAVVAALHRHGTRLDTVISDIELETGDCLLVIAADVDFISKNINSVAFSLVCQKAKIAAAVVVGMIIANAVGVNLVIAGLLAAAAMLITKCLTPQDALDSLDLTVIIMLAAALGISEAMIHSGAGTMVAKTLMKMSGNSQIGLITCTYIATNVFSLAITNSAAVTMMFPIALAGATSRHLDFRPFAYSLIMAAASALMTQISCSTNAMIHATGCYKFKDYIINGGPLEILLFGVTVGIISTLKWWWLWWIALTVLAIVSTPFIFKL